MPGRPLPFLALAAALSVAVPASILLSPVAAAKDGGSSGGSGSSGSSGSGSSGSNSGSSGSGSSGSGSSGSNSGSSGSNSGSGSSHSGSGSSGGSDDGGSDDGGSDGGSRGGSDDGGRGSGSSSSSRASTGSSSGTAASGSGSGSGSGSDRSIWEILGFGKGNGQRPRKGEAAAATPAEDHERARDAVLRGEAVPLAKVLPVVGKAVPGAVLEVKVGQLPGGTMSYEVKVLDREGTVRSVLVDARRNRVVGVR